ncbi:MAG: phage antirepressor protein [Opitutales bacterium]|nr:phage antirepressor protein [Opitutales bacterium]
MKTEIKIFEQHDIRSVYDEKNEKWFFSVIDLISVLTGSKDPRNYWKVLKNRLRKEGNQTVTNCNRLKMPAHDGKMRLTDALDVENCLRLVQSVPSPQAEPVKLWLARVGYERMKEMSDPSSAIDRARETYKKLGRSEKWIQQRMTGQETRNKLTDYWKNHDITEEREFAILTNIIHQEWSNLCVRDHKTLKKLKIQNLRDHMTEAELIFTALAELSTRNAAESKNATGMSENARAAKIGGGIARRAKEDFEAQTGKRVVSGENFLPNNDPKK